MAPKEVLNLSWFKQFIIQSAASPLHAYEPKDKLITLIDNIKKEYMAISKYEKHIAMINDKYIKRSLARIIEDEKIHIICFKNYLSKVVKREGS